MSTLSGFTDLFSVNTVVNVATYVVSWYEILTGTKDANDISDISRLDIDSDEDWGQFVVIDEEKINIFFDLYLISNYPRPLLLLWYHSGM